jgi:tetratricopeptide (TPR) repeat protein
VSAEFQGTAFSPASPAHPEQWELFELLTEGTTELNAHVKAHVVTGCPSCGKHLADIRTLSKAREMKEEFDAFFDELPQDDAPADEREEFLLKFKKKSRPADRLGRLAHDGRQLADEIVKAVSEEKEDGLEKAQKLLGKIESDPSRGYAFLYACQLAMPKVSSDPAMYVAFAKAVADATRSLPYLKDKGPAQPVCREQVLGEAALLESNALNYLGKPSEARVAAQNARISFVEAGEDSFALALADYFEGSAVAFVGDFPSAWRLLKGARSEFQSYGQENWQGRAEAALGVLLLSNGRCHSALHFLDGALRLLHPDQDGSSYASTLVGRGFSLVRIGRLDAAKATYARALIHARRLDGTLYLFAIRTGLATIELLKGNVVRALRSFERIHVDAVAGGFDEHALGASLRISECLARLGRADEVARHIAEVQHSPYALSFANDLAFRELFESVEVPSVAQLAHIADYFEGRNRGVRTPYKPFRLVANGN